MNGSDHRTRFVRLLQEMKARGFYPYYAAFVNERGHARALAHADIVDDTEFLHWLALDVAEPLRSRSDSA